VIAALAAGRWLYEAGLMALFGDAGLRLLLRAHVPALALPRGAWRRIAAPVALASGVLWFCLATAQMAGDPQAMIDPGLLGLAARQSLFGQIFIARLAVLVLLCLSVARGWRESATALFSGAALVLIAITGHAAEASPAHFTAIGASSDGLHLLTGGFWIGGLVLLAMLFARRGQTALLAGATAVFAEWGMIAVTVLVLTGMLNAATILLGGEGHDAPLYLSVLGAKLALVLAMLGLALFNHFRLLPRLREAAGADRLGKTIQRELLIGFVVVGLAALLGLLPPSL
jgi:putative copper resistance protein D